MAKFITEQNFGGLDYITVRLPVSRTSKEFGPVVSAKTLQGAELSVARFIVSNRVPIRGLEVKYLRKTFGLSLRVFANMLGVTHTAIAKWENKPKKRLEPINEVATRSLCAQLLKLNLSSWFNDLLGDKDAKKTVLTAEVA